MVAKKNQYDKITVKTGELNISKTRLRIRWDEQYMILRIPMSAAILEHIP